jgi:hypothetical protein
MWKKGEFEGGKIPVLSQLEENVVFGGFSGCVG